MKIPLRISCARAIAEKVLEIKQSYPHTTRKTFLTNESFDGF
jgi:hypothetical protein